MMRWYTPGVNFFVTPKKQEDKDLQDKMKGLWELKQFHFNNAPWNDDLTPNGKIYFHEDSDLVFVAINTSNIASSKNDEEFLKRLIFYFASWGISVNDKNQRVSEHDVLQASSQARVGALEKRISEITPEGYLKLSGSQPGTNKPIELIWQRPKPKQQKLELEPWMQPLALDFIPGSANKFYGVMCITPEGQLFFDASTTEMTTPKLLPSAIIQNILFYTGPYEKESETTDEIHLSCKIELFSDPRMHQQELKITIPKYSNGLVSFKLLDQEYQFNCSPVRSHIAHEHLSQNTF